MTFAWHESTPLRGCPGPVADAGEAAEAAALRVRCCARCRIAPIWCGVRRRTPKALPDSAAHRLGNDVATGHTQPSLVCLTVRPASATVAQVLREVACVHDARISTFGERVEDSLPPHRRARPAAGAAGRGARARRPVGAYRPGRYAAAQHVRLSRQAARRRRYAGATRLARRRADALVGAPNLHEVAAYGNR